MWVRADDEAEPPLSVLPIDGLQEQATYMYGIIEQHTELKNSENNGVSDSVGISGGFAAGRPSAAVSVHIASRPWSKIYKPGSDNLVRHQSWPTSHSAK